MKRVFTLLIIMVLGVIVPLTTTSCSRKSGCPAYDTLKAPVNRKGELSSKAGKSGLFPKDMQKGKKKKNK